MPKAQTLGQPTAKKAAAYKLTAHRAAILAMPSFRRTRPWVRMRQPRRARLAQTFGRRPRLGAHFDLLIRPLASTRDLVLRRGEGRTTGSEPSES